MERHRKQENKMAFIKHNMLRLDRIRINDMHLS